MTLNGRCALCCIILLPYGAHYPNLNENRPTLLGQECHPWPLVYAHNLLDLAYTVWIFPG